MCSGRVDLGFVLRAFANGMDGVFIGGCHLNECHYITDGNHHAYGMVQIAKKLMQRIGINPERLRIEQMSAGEGIRFAEVINDFSKKLRDLGRLESGIERKLQAARKLVPYIRLVERERLRVRCNSSEQYEEFFRREEVNRLFDELIGDKLALSEILLLLREKPRSAGEISEILGLGSSEVARHLNGSARQKLARFDQVQKLYVPA